MVTALDRLSDLGIGTGGRGSVWARPVHDYMLPLIPESMRDRWLTEQELDAIACKAREARDQETTIKIQ